MTGGRTLWRAFVWIMKYGHDGDDLWYKATWRSELAEVTSCTGPCVKVEHWAGDGSRRGLGTLGPGAGGSDEQFLSGK